MNPCNETKLNQIFDKSEIYVVLHAFSGKTGSE